MVDRPGGKERREQTSVEVFQTVPGNARHVDNLFDRVTNKRSNRAAHPAAVVRMVPHPMAKLRSRYLIIASQGTPTISIAATNSTPKIAPSFQ